MRASRVSFQIKLVAIIIYLLIRAAFDPYFKSLSRRIALQDNIFISVSPIYRNSLFYIIRPVPTSYELISIYI